MSTRTFRIFFLILFNSILINCFSQEMQVDSFTERVEDLTANTQPVMDLNNNKCALIKISIPDKAGFEGNIVESFYKINEYFLYVSPGTKNIVVKYPGVETLSVSLADYLDGSGVVSGRTYRLKLNGVPQPTNGPQIPNEERFAEAMTYMQSKNLKTLTKGIAILDSLDSSGYIPATYEQAFTYGWYPDSASLARKDILGIEYYPPSSKERFLPEAEYINRKAIGYLTKIEEAKNPDYPEINAQALYKLATYYNNTGRVFSRNKARAVALCEQALIWAEKSGNKDLYDKIEKNLKLLKQQK